MISHTDIINNIRSQYPKVDIWKSLGKSGANVGYNVRYKGKHLCVNRRDPSEIISVILDFCKYCENFAHQFKTYKGYLKAKNSPLWELLNE